MFITIPQSNDLTITSQGRPPFIMWFLGRYFKANMPILMAIDMWIKKCLLIPVLSDEVQDDIESTSASWGTLNISDDI